ncbi:MAG TPA: hypothetical protein VM694_01625, partial [Polyangium sp.]|nr:hypothetical protein [Polyangium sp.]
MIRRTLSSCFSIFTLAALSITAAGCIFVGTAGGGACEVNGEQFSVGEEFPAPGGCNTCTCQADGSTLCTRLACLATCTVNGQVFTEGDSFPGDGDCNTCTCGPDGSVSCTAKACAEPACIVDGVGYIPGDTFPSSDGCNTCTCGNDGMVGCTE